MNIKLSALKILKQAGKPLHVREITKRIIDSGLWKTSGKTPAATVGAQLYVDIKDNGDKSAFVQVERGTFALRDTAGNSTGTKKKTSIISNKKAKSLQKSTSLSFTDCAEKVLQTFADNKPMHYREITAKALDKGWLNTSGKTPEATMYAQVITEITRQQKRGEHPRFVQHGRGLVGLNDPMESDLALQIKQHNHNIRKTLRNNLLTLTPGEFEELISQLLAKMGFEDVEVTKLSGDGGIDVRGALAIGDVTLIRMAVQVKRWKLGNNILAPVVQQVRGSLSAHEQGLIITTSNFSRGAVIEAGKPDKSPIALINGEQLVILLMEHGFGVHRNTPELFEIDENFSLK